MCRITSIAGCSDGSGTCVSNMKLNTVVTKLGADGKTEGEWIYDTHDQDAIFDKVAEITGDEEEAGELLMWNELAPVNDTYEFEGGMAKIIEIRKDAEIRRIANE